MITFKKIKYKNILTVGNSLLEINLDTHKNTLIIGKNACGKSILLDALVFCLFGKPYRKTNKPLLINSKNKSNLLVELEFTIGTKNYLIKRGLKPNIFEIYIDGELVNQTAATKDYQKYLEEYILKTNYQSFLGVVILGSARYNPFMQMSAPERRTIIEELLGIQIFSIMNGLVKDKLSKIKDDYQQTSHALEITTEKINFQKQNIKDQKQNKKLQIKQKQEDIKTSNEQIQQLQHDIVLVQKHIDILQHKIKDESLVGTKRNKLIAIESKIETSLKSLQKETSFYTNHDTCPTCKQSIEDKFKAKRIKANNKKQEEFNQGLSKLNNEMTVLNDRLNIISDLNKHIQEHHSEIVRMNASITAIQNYIQKELNYIETLNTESGSIENNTDKLKELTSELSALKSNLDKIINDKKYYDFTALLLKDGGIKTRIIKQYLPILNKLINTYLSQLDFFVNFNIDENFNEVIKSRNRDTHLYTNFSEGEKTRIDLAIMFAFRQLAKIKNSVNTNLLIMDEIMDGSADGECLELFFTLIDKFDDNIFIISHRQEQHIDKFDRVLRFTKKNDFTRMIEI